MKFLESKEKKRFIPYIMIEVFFIFESKILRDKTMNGHSQK